MVSVAVSQTLRCKLSWLHGSDLLTTGADRNGNHVHHTRKQRYLRNPRETNQAHYLDYMKLRPSKCTFFLKWRSTWDGRYSETLCRKNRTNTSIKAGEVFPGCPIFSERVTYSPGSKPHFIHSACTRNISTHTVTVQIWTYMPIKSANYRQGPGIQQNMAVLTSHTHARTHACTHARTHTHAHTHTHTHTHSLLFWSKLYSYILTCISITCRER